LRGGMRPGGNHGSPSGVTLRQLVIDCNQCSFKI
jgi:hypothetical protein